MATTSTSADPCTVVIFGASGDLTQRKIVPALHSLSCEGLLDERTRIVGVARSPLTDEELRARLYEGVVEHARLEPSLCDLWPHFAHRITYIAGDYGDPDTLPAARRPPRGNWTPSRARATGSTISPSPPQVYVPVVRQLGQADLCRSERGWCA